MMKRPLPYKEPLTRGPSQGAFPMALHAQRRATPARRPNVAALASARRGAGRAGERVATRHRQQLSAPLAQAQERLVGCVSVQAGGQSGQGQEESSE